MTVSIQRLVGCIKTASTSTLCLLETPDRTPSTAFFFFSFKTRNAESWTKSSIVELSFPKQISLKLDRQEEQLFLAQLLSKGHKRNKKSQHSKEIRKYSRILGGYYLLSSHNTKTTISILSINKKSIITREMSKIRIQRRQQLLDNISHSAKEITIYKNIPSITNNKRQAAAITR